MTALVGRKTQTESGCRKVAIIGYTPHREKAPWNDGDCELWMLNDLYLQVGPYISKATDAEGVPVVHRRMRWFQLHAFDQPRADGRLAPYSVDQFHLERLIEYSAAFPVYLKEARPEVPAGRPFPYAAVYEAFAGKAGAKYFTNSISFFIAFAILEGFEEIHLYGVDMMTSAMPAGGGGAEYSYQRPSCEYWMGIAEGYGVKVVLPEECDLLKCAFPYGDELGTAFRRKIEYELQNARKAKQQHAGQQAQVQAILQQLEGKIVTLETLLNTWMPGDTFAGAGDPTQGRVMAPIPGANRVRGPAPRVEATPAGANRIAHLAPLITPAPKSDGEG